MKKNQRRGPPTVTSRRTSPRRSQNIRSETTDPVYDVSTAAEEFNKPSRRSMRLSARPLTQYTNKIQTAQTLPKGLQFSQPEPTDSEVSQPLDSISAFMTSRKRAATIAQLDSQEDPQDKNRSKHTREDSEATGTSGSSGNSLAHICLCQPDPKIPRPRNGKLYFFRNATS